MPQAGIYEGGCQCGKVRFRADLAMDKVMTCNCSRCQKLGSMLTFTSPDRFTLLSGEDALSEYLFNKHAIRHMFCATCGIEPFARGSTPTGMEMVAVNVRCLDGVEPDEIAVTKVNGRAF
jgi:hypothetical protein